MRWHHTHQHDWELYVIAKQLTVHNQKFLDLFVDAIVVPDHLNVEQNAANLVSESIWGILRGMETFSQLLFESPDANGVSTHQKCRPPTNGVFIVYRHLYNLATNKRYPNLRWAPVHVPWLAGRYLTSLHPPGSAEAHFERNGVQQAECVPLAHCGRSQFSVWKPRIPRAERERRLPKRHDILAHGG